MAIRNAISADMIVGPKGIGPDGRGLTVYQLTELVGVDAAGKDGERHRVTYEQPLFYLTIDERAHIFKQCAPIFGIVTGRMNRVSGLEWKITKESKMEDRRAEILKYFYGIYKDYAGDMDPRSIVMKSLLLKEIRRTLPDLKPDGSNFDRSLLRWSKLIKFDAEDRSSEIEDWVSRPNTEDDFEELTKKMVFDLMIHGSTSVYKKDVFGCLGSIHPLPGGSIIPIKEPVVSGLSAYVQIVDGFDPLIYYQDELYYSDYIPTTFQSYGMIPLEALVNKVAEYLLFDELAAQRADATKPAEKLIVLGDHMPFGATNAAFTMALPMNPDDQKRVEQIINEERKDAIRVISGVGQPVVVDVSREDLFQHQSERQRQLKEDIALVFNTTNMEVNISGSEGTSGRSTSESQEKIDQAKGIGPIVKILERMWNNSILPDKFGGGYLFDFDIEISEKETIELLQAKVNSGLWTDNELRIESGNDPVEDEAADKLHRSKEEQKQLGLFGGGELIQ